MTVSQRYYAKNRFTEIERAKKWNEENKERAADRRRIKKKFKSPKWIRIKKNEMIDMCVVLALKMKRVRLDRYALPCKSRCMQAINDYYYMTALERFK